MGDIEKIWDEHDGSGVTVVVYDEGVQYTHPGLMANFDTTFFTYDGVVYDPMPIDDQSGHGTSCAGLIGATWNNGIGGCGVAPGVTLSAVNYLDDIQYQPTDVYDAAMLWAENFDVMSNSGAGTAAIRASRTCPLTPRRPAVTLLCGKPWWPMAGTVLARSSSRRRAMRRTTPMAMAGTSAVTR